MKVALIHYWLVGMRGGEKVLEALCEIFPEADIFTLVADPEKLSPRLRKHRIHTSFLQKIGGRTQYQKMLPLMPLALESFDLSAYDVVISSESGPAKGIIPRPDSVHICYCHSPMRYVWDLQPQYIRESGLIARNVLRMTGPSLRQWDVSTSARVDHFIANSAFVAKRIEKYYRRESTVINPPVDLARFAVSDAPEDFYLCAGQITPYKKIDIAIEAFNRMKKPLVILGSGASKALRSKAGPTITFLGSVEDSVMAEKFAKCRALVFPGVEDFGIVPLEVMASGRPVIAYARGGAMETVVEGRTGTFFHEQSPEALIEAVTRFETHAGDYDPEEIRAWARRFDVSAFSDNLRGFFRGHIEGFS